MKTKYITITGIRHYYGNAPFAVGRKVTCQKEKHNPYDREAIRVTMKHVGTVGYVANSTNTTVTGTMSAGRIYEKVGKKFKAKVVFVMPWQVICEIVEEDCKKRKKAKKEQPKKQQLIEDLLWDEERLDVPMED